MDQKQLVFLKTKKDKRKVTKLRGKRFKFVLLMVDYRSKECAKVGSALEWRFEKGERMSFSCSTKSE